MFASIKKRLFAQITRITLCKINEFDDKNFKSKFEF